MLRPAPGSPFGPATPGRPWGPGGPVVSVGMRVKERWVDRGLPAESRSSTIMVRVSVFQPALLAETETTWGPGLTPSRHIGVTFPVPTESRSTEAPSGKLVMQSLWSSTTVWAADGGAQHIYRAAAGAAHLSFFM